MNFRIKHVHLFNIGTVWETRHTVISLPFKKTFEEETVGNFMQCVLK
jgi:hypothetical protein